MAKRQFIIFITLLNILTLYSQTAHSELYKWKDEHGKIHFSDKEPTSNASARDVEQIEKKEVQVTTFSDVTLDDVGVNVPKSVVMYSTSWCYYCKKAREYFKQKGIRFRELDIEKNAQARKAYDRMGLNGVPIILVGKKKLRGFSAAKFDRLYNE